jgi:hypothetical protein
LLCAGGPGQFHRDPVLLREWQREGIANIGAGACQDRYQPFFLGCEQDSFPFFLPRGAGLYAAGQDAKEQDRRKHRSHDRLLFSRFDVRMAPKYSFGTDFGVFPRPPYVERILMGDNSFRNKINSSILSNLRTPLNPSEILLWRDTAG